MPEQATPPHPLGRNANEVPDLWMFGFTAQSGVPSGFAAIKALPLSKVMSFWVPPTDSPVASRVTAKLTCCPGKPFAEPTSIETGGAVGVGVALGVGVFVAVGVRVGVFVGVLVGVLVGVGVFVGVLVGVLVGVSVFFGGPTTCTLPFTPLAPGTGPPGGLG
jgi:hypothetical protein